MAKYLEGMSLRHLRRQCIKLSFPASVMRFTLHAYSSPIYIALNGAIAGPHYANNGVIG